MGTSPEGAFDPDAAYAASLEMLHQAVNDRLSELQAVVRDDAPAVFDVAASDRNAAADEAPRPVGSSVSVSSDTVASAQHRRARHGTESAAVEPTEGRRRSTFQPLDADARDDSPLVSKAPSRSRPRGLGRFGRPERGK